ncbi:hypothetical protein SAMN04488498_10438 [Mesorhizobium albiziae]|uniref:Uncharacterized protein n=1 Tax=Neomesorhizobium albiziae TaxID=335020 RepID=A0A1I3XZ87_9HYPH|nr:hypothetical protein [Mesorhizobium albiziae]GLS30252.1 hypothetical protein GCM10007937_19600 [Mesorhizobium albiziae]SFK24371.1 hypothetical protein SAMN04488498_10438 [Mesorhizobium albiziae]
MLIEPPQTIGYKRPRALLRLLALLLLALAIAEVPFGTARVSAQASEPAGNAWLAQPDTGPARHSLSEKTALEIWVDATLQAVTSYPYGHTDEPVLAAAGPGGGQIKCVAAHGSLLATYVFPVSACLSSARDPPLTA